MIARKLIVAIALAWICSAGATPAQGQSWSNGYAFRRAITIDHTKVPNTDQPNFPILVSGTFVYLANVTNGGGVVNTNGYDIIFTSDAAGTSVLSFEQESYSASTGAVNYWVRIPTLSHSVDTVIYLFYGNGSIATDQSNSAGTWSSNYLSVWHLSQDPTAVAPQIRDSTSNSNNATAQGMWTSSQQSGGKIGGSLNFVSTSNDYLSTANSFASPGPQTLTVQAWFKSTSTSGTKIIGYESPQTGTSASGYDRQIWLGTDGKIYGGVYTCTYPGKLVSSSTYNDGSWHQAVLTLDSSAQQAKLYVDGTQAGSTITCTGAQSYSGYFRIGGYGLSSWTNAANGYFNGSVDEARVSSIARSPDWIAVEFNNQSNPGTFYSVGAADVNGSGGSTSPYIAESWPASGPISTPVTILGANFGATQGSSTVTFNGTQASPNTWSDSSIRVPVPSAAISGNLLVTVSGVSSNATNFTVTLAPAVTSLTPSSGIVGSQVTINGFNFGATQGSSSATLNGVNCSVVSWTDSAITFVVPTGATSGPFVVTVGGQTATSPAFTVLALPPGWLHQDVGSVSPAGSATYASGVFTVKSSGDIGGTADGFHFVYQSLTGDGTIVARLATNAGNFENSGVMIRESLNANSTNVALIYQYRSSNSPLLNWQNRPTTGANTAYPTIIQNLWLPYWVKLVRSGTTFTGYTSLDGVNWSQLGSSQTINMAQTVYIGLAVSGNYSLNTATFDHVSLTSSTSVPPVIGSVSATTGNVGSQVLITGSNFGATQGSSLVLLNDAPVTINSWSATSISITIPSGATAGSLTVALAPSMVESNPVTFTVTSNPLPAGWLDQDVGATTLIGSSSYSNGVFTILGAGCGVRFCGSGAGPVDAFHFVYQQLTGDGTILARVVSLAGNSSGLQAGIDFRETLGAGSANEFFFYAPPYAGSGSVAQTYYRSSAGTTPTLVNSIGTGLPYWMKIVRTGSMLNAYTSSDGTNWSQFGGYSWTSMAQTVYVGFGAAGTYSSSGFTTATFDNVSVTSVASPAPNIGALSTTTGPVGTQVVISGTGFGTSQGSSVVYLNGLATTINSWSATSISITIPTSATSGPLTVAVAPNMINSNAVYFAVTSQPLLSGWIDQDVGSVGLHGSASYSGGTFTVSGGGFIGGGSDAFHFVYQPLTSNGTLVARLVSIQGGVATAHQAGIMVRETMDSSSANVFNYIYWDGGSSYTRYLLARTAPGGYATQTNTANAGVPYWFKLVRNANTFTGYVSADGVTWAQIGTAQTFTTSQTVYIGLAVGGGGTSAQTTATFDNVSLSLGTTLPNPVITGLSRISGSPETSVTINGSGFGATQGTSTANFNGASAAITSWSDTQIVAIVPQAASIGPVTVQESNITAQGPLFTVSMTAQITDSLGNQSTYVSQVFGSVWRPNTFQGSGCSTCTDRGNLQYLYDQNGNTLYTVDAMGNKVTNVYDANNNVTSRTQPINSSLNATTTYTYNNFGEVLTATDPLNHVTTNTYDSRGNLLTVTTPSPDGSTAGSVTTFTYNTLGELTTIKDPLNNVTTLTYTPVGLISTITDAQSNVTTYTYDSHGNRTSVKDALNNTTTFAYDAGDRLATITYSDSTTTTFGYDYRGRRTSVTDQNGKVTSYAYDDADRLTSVTDAANHVTAYGYDLDSNLTSITDANNNATTFTYDAYGRVTKTTFPSTLFETYAYDANNNLTSKTDRKSQTITYSYDQSNRLTQKTYPDSSTVTYNFDNASRLTQVIDPTGTYGFTFDNMGRLTGTTVNYTFVSRTFTNSYTYDKASNRTGFTDPESGSNTYAYDTLNRLSTLTPPSAFTTGSFGFSYDALSRRTQMTRPNSVTTNYAYDNLSRLTSVLHQLAGSTIDGATYTVDNAGNRTAKTDQRTAVTTNYGYDAIYQLLSATQGASTTESYAYDPVGNRTASLGVPSYTTNNSNELTATSNASYGYDYNGNTVTKNDSTGITTYAWDFENRLTSVTLPGSGGTITFKYDPFGRRIYKSSSAGTSIYAYDEDGNLVEETNAVGTSVARYTQGLNIDEPLVMLRSGTTSYYEQDGIGSVTSLSSPASVLTNTYTLDSFGNLTAFTGSVTNPFRYTAREFDSEVGVYFLRARYLDTTIGRFISEDPIEFSGGVNFYIYVKNRPADFTDPGGRNACGGTDCSKADPLPSTSSKCDSYGNEIYEGASLKCFCKCAGDSAWSRKVRGCLACEHDKGTNPYVAHAACYAAGGLSSAPWVRLSACYLLCYKKVPKPPV